jgi:myo-inositol-1(or 4)-monophosphatase
LTQDIFRSTLGTRASLEEMHLLEVAYESVQASFSAARNTVRWGLTSGHHGQHEGDVEADDAALRVLHHHGLSVLSEESGLTNSGEVTAVIDPVDGSSNVARGLPYWCSSVALVRGDQAFASVVVAMPFGDVYWALDGRGAYFNSTPLRAGKPKPLGSSVVFLNGHSTRHLGWAQYRALGSAALELCMVASGVGDCFVDVSQSGLALWDYLGALVICRETGKHIVDRFGRELEQFSLDTRRNVIAGSSKAIVDELVDRLSREIGAHVRSSGSTSAQ